MSTSSDPREWYRQEELARDRARQRMTGSRRSVNLVYLVAAVIAVLIIFLLMMAYAPLPGMPRIP
jgi:hypothetical protein